MKSFKEMREEAWKKVTSRWFFRMLAAVGFLSLIAGAVNGSLQSYYRTNEIATWQDFALTVMQYMRAGLTLTVPSSQQFWAMTQATFLQQFLAMLFNGIVSLGVAAITLKAVRGDETHWFASAYHGFRIPLSVLWMNFLLFLIILFGLFLFVIPGVIFIFMFTMAWYVKCDHPDYSATECLGASSRLMRGHKLQLLLFLLSYFGWFMLAAFALSTAVVIMKTMPGAALFALANLGFAAFVAMYVVFGKGVFYEELKRISENKTDDTVKVDEV